MPVCGSRGSTAFVEGGILWFSIFARGEASGRGAQERRVNQLFYFPWRCLCSKRPNGGKAWKGRKCRVLTSGIASWRTGGSPAGFPRVNTGRGGGGEGGGGGRGGGIGGGGGGRKMKKRKMKEKRRRRLRWARSGRGDAPLDSWPHALLPSADLLAFYEHIFLYYYYYYSLFSSLLPLLSLP